MTLNEYQERAMSTCTPESNNFSYMMLGLVEELGELSGKVAKAIRKGKAFIANNHLLISGSGQNYMTYEEIDAMRKEAGDIAWMFAGLCTVMGWSLEDVLQENLDKLADRKNRGVIVSEGDNR